MSGLLIDDYGRRIRKLRVSLLDVCNFRCFYCMPENMKFMKPAHWLSPDEIERVCGILCDYGLEQIRLTGGEPILRPEFRDIVTRLSNLPLRQFGMTTNGYHLARELSFLAQTNCRHINVSLDSLIPEKFNAITKRTGFDQVYKAILKCKEMGFSVKINTVIMRGINDQEIFEFADFSRKYGIEVRFLEVMKIGEACGSQDEMFISADEVIDRLKEKMTLVPQKVARDSTSFNFVTPSGSKISFIASESKPFCNSCSRWRLSADGFLRACLMSNKGVKVKGLLAEEFDASLKTLLTMKPNYRIESIEQNMNQIGG